MESNKAKVTIDGNDLFNWFHSGAKEVNSNKGYLNSINVFPVADGDTGTNLSLTLGAMVEQTEVQPSFSSAIKRLSETGLASARGNSGTIFASYVNGLAVNGADYDTVGLAEFSGIANKAVDHLYEAVEEPVEGTMISVIREWADFLFHNHHRFDSFQSLMEAAYRFAGKALEETTAQLAVLKKYKVVDSGAAGFVGFLKGINHFFAGAPADVMEADASIPHDDTEDEVIKFPFCTEILLTAEGKDPTFFRQLLHGHGDSLIVSSAGDKVKIHIHTDHPEEIVSILKEESMLLNQRVDDTRLQSSVAAERRHSVGILTDSIADIPEEFKLEHQIHTIPLGLILDDVVYLDKQTIHLAQLFREIPNAKTYPTSSQPEPGRIRDTLTELLDHYDSVIVITIASKLSGTNQAFRQELKRMDTQGKKVTVIDSRLNSGAEGLLVARAAHLLDQGKCHDEVVAEVESMIPRTKIYVCLETLEYAAKGGRVPNSVGKIGMMIGLRPIMTLDETGKGATFGMGLSQKSITGKILKLVRSAMADKGIEAYSIVHADNLPLALEYKESLTKIIGKEPEFISEISSIIAIHSGPGSVAVCVTERP